MNRFAAFIVLASLLPILGCPSGENASVEHANVCIDLSPNGQSIVFSSANGDLYLFDLVKKSVKRLTETKRTESYPSFSPDGKRIVFAASESDTAPHHIFLLELSTLAIEQLTDDPKTSDILPRFTVDGKRIVFARAYRHRPYSLGGWTWDMWDVCSIGADGTGLARLTEEGYYQLYRIVPRSNGAFVYAADPMDLEIPAALYAVTPNNKPTQLIPKPGTNNEEVNAWASDPMVSPDGEAMVFCSDRTKPFWYDVCIETEESNAKSLVGLKSRYNRYPDFFPDAQRIVFLAGTEFNAGSRPIYSLWEVSLSGQTRELATSDLFTNPTNWLAPTRAEQ